MSKKIISKPLTIAIGAAMAGGLTAAAANAEITADENPFAMEELTGGQLFAGAHEGGGSDDTEGGDEGEGSCGEDKGEGSCGEDKGEGSCGEGKCGGAA